MERASYVHRGGTTPLIGAPIADFLGEVAARHPDHDALVSLPQNVRLSYRALFEEVDRVAKGLMAMGVERGDRVGIWSTNNVQWVLLQVATARVGAVLVNINPAYRVPELAHALTAARIQTLVLEPSFRTSNYVEMVRELCPELDQGPPGELASARLPALRRVIVYDPANLDATARPGAGFMIWPELVRAGAEVSDQALAERANTLEADDPINIQFTSGTTGFPKPVTLTHHNILNNAYFTAEVMRFTGADRLCVPVPFYHCFGMVLSNLLCLCRGAAIVIPAQYFDPGATLAAVARERCTAVHGVPTMFVAMLERPEFGDLDLSSLRTGIMAGAPCPPELMRRVMGDMGCREILIGYGQTEASPITHITRIEDDVDRRVNTVGTNLPYQEVKVVDAESGRIVPLGTQGEVCFRGYHVMRGYYEMPEATATSIDPAGWLHSGDLGVMDDSGYVRITGRLKDMIIRGGENVYPAEVEAYLLEHPAVVQAAVFGVPHDKWGEEVWVWVQLHADAKADPEAALKDLRGFANKGLSHYKVPRHWRVVDEFPMTVTGKIQKFRMRELIVAEEAGQGGGDPG
ncbi:AMP-binding protein [Haliangium sp.]|uniref:AMP-binding protein n=1 Tax=Haliangium sp. TaxID=2663208 RepID=UPI003D0B931C